MSFGNDKYLMRWQRGYSAIGVLLFLAAGTHNRHNAFAVPNVETAPVDESRFEKQVVAGGCKDAIQMDISADARLVFIERTGAVKLVKLREQQTVQIAKLPVAYIGEVGLIGIVLDNEFTRNGWIYFAYCPESNHGVMRLSRFTLVEDKIELSSEKVLLEYAIDEPAALHMGGGLVMDKHGNLYMGTGDNSPPIAELPVDQRPGKEFYDALRSSANSRDLRGKILRIRPRADGGYDIPAGNLFSDAKDGRPEIYCMGCRNPFRLVIDDRSGVLYWGDVGPNILDPSLKLGPDGYDEINRTATAGNFGWPMFVGPNEPYRNFDFATRKTGESFDVTKPINFSRNNTGAKLLPHPKPAWIWYPNIVSKEFPELGSGGRSAMAGPTYHHDLNANNRLGMPAAYDGAVFVYDWMRNWIKTVRVDETGKPTRIEPFVPHMAFRKPIDMKFGPDGCLYLIDYGNVWSGNTDGQILRVVYRRGNRPPVAIAKASPAAGKQPLHVHVSARESYDKDANDRLLFSWGLGTGKKVFSREVEAHATFDSPGTYPIALTVTDSHGESSTTTLEVHVGNAPPKVTLLEPNRGGFFDWGDRIRYRVEVDDEEDGSTQDDPAKAARIRVQGQYFVQRPGSASDQEGLLEPGLALMRKTTCFSCHSVQSYTGGGPAYFDVSRKYRHQKDARELLANKIVSGGAGVWGEKPMPAHPQHTFEQVRLMAEWVLSLAAEGMGAMVGGPEGVIELPKAPPAGRDAGVYVLSASYADNGADGAPPLTGETSIVLHSRKKMAVAFERRHGVELVEVFVVGPCGRFSNGGWIAFDDVDLSSIDYVDCNVSQASIAETMLELRANSADGQLLGQTAIPTSGGSERFTQVTIPIQQRPNGACSLYVVARAKNVSDVAVANLRELLFVDSSAASKDHRREQAELTKLALSQPVSVAARGIVKQWTFDDLKPVLDSSAHGRSFERGKQLFRIASCSFCHRLGNEGGILGPDLSESVTRLNRKPNSGEAILREIVRPSEVVDPKYRVVSLLTLDGLTLAGIIVRQNAVALWLVSNSETPKVEKEVRRSEIERIDELHQSLMPEGLLNTLNKDEIADLLAYVCSAADPKNPAFDP